jgi:hypothetical protein
MSEVLTNPTIVTIIGAIPVVIAVAVIFSLVYPLFGLTKDNKLCPTCKKYYPRWGYEKKCPIGHMLETDVEYEVRKEKESEEWHDEQDKIIAKAEEIAPGITLDSDSIYSTEEFEDRIELCYDGRIVIKVKKEEKKHD